YFLPVRCKTREYPWSAGGKSHRLADCNKLQSQVAPARQPVCKRSQGVRAIAAQRAVCSVVQAKHVSHRAAARILRSLRDRLHLPLKPFSRPGSPVAGNQCPHRGLHTKSASRTDHPWIADAVWRSKVFGAASSRCRQSFLASFHLHSHRAWSHPEKIGVRLGVIRKQMPAIGNFSRQYTAFSHEPADSQKTRL